MKWTGSKKISKEEEEEEEEVEEETGDENREEGEEGIILRSRKTTEIENLSSIDSQFEMDENAMEEPSEEKGGNLS